MLLAGGMTEVRRGQEGAKHVTIQPGLNNLEPPF